MREGWRRIALGDAATQYVEPLQLLPDEEYQNIGVKWYGEGTFLREPKLGSEIKATRLFRVRPGQFVYNRMFVTEGSFGIVRPEDKDAVASNEFPVFDIAEDTALADFIGLHFQQPDVWAQIASEATGTTKSRRRWKEDQFLRYTVALPPLDEQRRIVDLIGSVDDAIEAAEESVVTSGAVLSELSRLPVPGAENDRLGNLVLMRSGPSWKSADESKTPIPGFVPVLGITNTPVGRALDLSDRRFVTSVPDSAQRLDESSIVMIRTNGNRSRIGNVYRAAKAVEGFAVSAFQIAIRPHDPADADFLYWYLGSPEVQDAISGNASGSTGLGNIAVGWLKQLSIPNLSAGDRSAYVARCGAADDVHRSAQASVSRLRDLRSNLLTVLLSGDHEIPESYDELLEEAPA